jgi:hypothetical protein
MNPMTKTLHLKRPDKSGTQKARKSLMCDGSFVADLLACGYFDRSNAVSHPLVVRLTPINLPLMCSPAKPKHWRDIDEAVRGIFYSIAIRGRGEFYALTLRLSLGAESLIRAQGKHALSCLHRRVVRQLRRIQGAPNGIGTLFWFCIEEDSKKRLHLHGEIAFESRNRRLIRKALKRAGGAWDSDAAEFQLRLRLNPNLRWAGYCLKEAEKARPSRRRYMQKFGSPRNMVAGFEGSAVTASMNLKRAAIECHRAAVAEVIRFRTALPTTKADPP